MKTQLIDKGRSGKRILTYVIFCIVMLVLSYSSSRGISFDDKLSDWTSDHLLSIISLILAGCSFFAVIYFSRYSIFNATCPYCQTKNELMQNANHLKCKACRKISVRKGNWLEPIP